MAGNFRIVLMACPKKFRHLKIILSLSFFLFLLISFFFRVQPVRADWTPDSEVTAVGRASERSRQLLFWFFSHPSLDNSPTIRLMWATSRNIALAFLVLVVVGFGFQLILSKEKAKLQTFFPKLVAMIIFCVFSYVLVLGLIQLSEVTMRFFIEKVAGQNLFNITFAGGNVEANYTNFVGYRENSPLNLESAKTGLFLVKTTTLTYNVIFIMLVIRKIALWLMLILAPFLPLLFAFHLVKNVGWIWIGVFFQWLFYGPLFSIFLTGLVKIWEGGIPFSFDFSRAGKPEGQIYLTAINILYGGPAQTLSPLNSANYVDTYAEYLIGLLMLWVVTLLPWLLLRNFRDYCCEVLKSLEAATMSLYSRLTAGTLPPGPPAGFGRAKIELPFRQQLEKVIPGSVVISSSEKERLTKMKTEEILGAMGLKVNRLADISRLDINVAERKAADQKLDFLKTPSTVSDLSTRQQYSVFNQELSSRVTQGDTIAERILATDSRMPAVAVVRMAQQPVRIVAGERVPTKENLQKVREVAPGVTSAVSMAGLAQRPEKVVTKEQVSVKEGISRMAEATSQIRKVSVEDYEEVKKMWVNNYQEGEVPLSGKVKSREEWLKDEVVKISDTIELLSSKEVEKRQAGLERVGSVLPFLYLGGFNEEQTLIYLKAKLEAAKQASSGLSRISETVSTKTAEGEESFVSVKRSKEKQELKEEQFEQVVRLSKTPEKQEEVLDSLGVNLTNLAEVSRLDMNTTQRQTINQRLEGLPSLVAEETLAGASQTPFKATAVTGKAAGRASTTTIKPITRTVSVEDYEEVKKMWSNNYRQGQVEVSQSVKTREDWLKEEVARISDTVELLSTKDEQKKKAGLARVGGILPFLYLGGFSEEQMLVYLKAKLEAAKQVQSELVQAQEREVTKTTPGEEGLVSVKRTEEKKGTKEEQFAETAALKNLAGQPEEVGAKPVVSSAGGGKVAVKPEEVLETLGLKITNLSDVSHLDMNATQKQTVNQKLENLSPSVSLSSLMETQGKVGAVAGGGAATTKPTPKTVSVEDYEEVKRMWSNNYRQGQVEVSPTVKTREDWLKEETARISDTVELLSTKDCLLYTSPSPRD